MCHSPAARSREGPGLATYWIHEVPELRISVPETGLDYTHPITSSISLVHGLRKRLLAQRLPPCAWQP
jgi:hypothetical protein